MPNPRTPTRFAKLSRRAQWGLLIASSVPLAALLEVAALPAALLLGPMIAGIIVGSNGGTIRAPRLAVFAAQQLAGDGRAVDGAARQSEEVAGGIGNLMSEVALGRHGGAAADGRQEGDLVAFGQRGRGRRKLLIQSQHGAGRHLAELRKTGGVMFKHGFETATFRDVERVLTDPHHVAQNAEKQDTDAHLAS